MCEGCSELPKDGLRRYEDLCQECWKEMESETFPLWKKGLGEEEVLRYQARLFQGTSRLHHQTYCKKCWNGFRACETLIATARREEGK